jgi:hypothetical protein
MSQVTLSLPADNSVVPSTSPVTPVLTDEQKGELTQLQQEFRDVQDLGIPYHRGRALNFRAQHKWVSNIGKDAVSKYAETVLGMKSEARTLSYVMAAQAVTGISVYGEKNLPKRHTAHNLVTPVAKMLEALEHFRSKHAHLDDEQFIAWYFAMGKWSGLWDSYKEDTKTTSSESTGTSDADKDEDGEQVEATILSMFNDPAAQPIKFPDLTPGTVRLFAVRSEGEGASAVPLIVTPAFIASLAGALPDPLNGAPDDLLFWRHLITVGERIIPDAISDVPVSPVAADDAVNETTPMLESHAMFLVRDGMFSVASGRNHDTLVVEASPLNPGALGLNLHTDGFLNNRSRRVMNSRLTEPRTCRGFIPKKQGDQATRVTMEGGKATVEFKHRDRKLNGRLIVTPRSEMKSAWTYCIDGFKPKAQHALGEQAVADLKAGFLAKAAKKPLPITVAFTDAGVSFKHGKADPLTYPADVTGSVSDSVTVDHGDFMRAMAGLLDAPLVGGLIWKVDPRGLLMVEGTTEHATFRVYLQTLRSDGGRQHKLLSLVQSTAAEAEADQAA